MLLAWNTLEEVAAYLSSETNKNWTVREVIQACDDNGIFPHVQILTNRPELPLWMREGEMAELPHNLDLQRFLSGDGVVHIVRREGLIYTITPGIKYELNQLRLSKAALCQLLALLKQKAAQPIQQAAASMIKDEALSVAASDDNDTDEDLAKLFDPVPVQALEKMFPANDRWKGWVEKAKRNGLIKAREGRAMFNPYKAGMWFVNNGAQGWDIERLYRVLEKKLPLRSRDSGHLFSLGLD